MRTFFLGPFLALLPRRWRVLLRSYESIEWRIAGTLSGFGEALFALVAILLWYSYSVTGWVSRGLDSALAGKMGPAPTEHEIGFMALVIFATHPLTWLIAYLGAEGSIRMVGAAFTESYLGVLPLFLLDKIYLKITGRSEPSAAAAAGFEQSNFASYKRAIRERVHHSRNAPVPDELFVSKNGDDEILEIRACRRKADWTPPRTVHYQNTFYRLEASSDGPEPRPYRYHLRRLSAGVMGRTVLVYSPEDPPVLATQ
ncbi:MAG TPA: hypothetical protein VE263_22035 [Candidatus Angelobacter sp.]|nr:hypothetical protein [Candidatus Angelobacter sp.]